MGRSQVVKGSGLISPLGVRESFPPQASKKLPLRYSHLVLILFLRDIPRSGIVRFRPQLIRKCSFMTRFDETGERSACELLTTARLNRALRICS